MLVVKNARLIGAIDSFATTFPLFDVPIMQPDARSKNQDFR
jgi:hypothetical protein